MKKILIGLVAIFTFNSCTQVAGWFGSNSDSTSGMHADSSSYAAYARDMSITEANAYSDLFLDSNAVELFIEQEKLPDSSANVLVAQLTFVDKSSETKWLLVLSLDYARQKALRRKTFHLFSIKRSCT